MELACTVTIASQFARPLQKKLKNQALYLLSHLHQLINLPNKPLLFHDFLGPKIKFHDFPGLENEILTFHDFPGFHDLYEP